mmetsp:Transcript_7007/g.8728  ORF Transcript_7007/g.8728 Transcript_7007/m.8728 type:complete len:305 (+) Transcript_7007:152-1066(+)|eukprot:CAMPEP_0203643842 /NCGR_PEP_ID=MMETSP0088-20131115/9281_1 /ASSEMBLY_ACC=CAM_ASM_001087 /TAXON_ID=426623 /ORGANISM="Chaetoceros affinis, Strain CCMP159" /LENGTH=304 /DNA_ID=CAMNT_0050500155 /DNA_START=16 /DNA_END=930 /DNA_ORIENTATION=-
MTIAESLEMRVKPELFSRGIAPIDHVKKLQREISIDSTYSGSSFSSFSSQESTISTNGFYKKSKRESLKELISDRQWERSIDVVKCKSRVAKKKFIVPCFLNEYRGKAEIYPIHQALSSPSVPLELIDALLFAYPKGIHKKDSAMRRNCLHIALRAAVRDEVLIYLIEKYPSLVCEQDSQGRVPLHYATSNFASFEVIKKMVNICPKAIAAPDEKGWTPLHVAVSKSSNPEVVELFLAECPEAIGLRTNAGSNPLKIVELCPSVNSEFFVTILSDKGSEFERQPSFTNFREPAQKSTSIEDSYV